MNIPAQIFLFVNALLLLFLPRRWAPLPLLVGVCYMTMGQGIEIGPFSFTVIRMIIGFGFIRVILRRERFALSFNKLDMLIVAFAAWAIICCFFRVDVKETFINRLGLFYDTCGIYFLMRIFCQSWEELVGIVSITAILLVPVAIEMLNERMTGHNMFSLFGGVPETSLVRRGSFRAQGPFRHAILAGSVGSACLPLMIGMWYQNRKYSVLGVMASLTMIFSCGSSGPILSGMAGIGVLFLWKIRDKMHIVRRVAIGGYLILELLMKAPAYFLMARIHLGTGGTGWHRAELIQTAVKHLNEWWLIGTDYTRHWMPYGVTWSPDHIDITNHYIAMGVRGGLLLMLLFILCIVKGFFCVGEAIKRGDEEKKEALFFLWSIGASLFAHAATMISARYFDQSFVFLYLVLAITGSLGVISLKGQAADIRSSE